MGEVALKQCDFSDFSDFRDFSDCSVCSDFSVLVSLLHLFCLYDVPHSRYSASLYAVYMSVIVLHACQCLLFY